MKNIDLEKQLLEIIQAWNLDAQTVAQLSRYDIALKLDLFTLYKLVSNIFQKTEDQSSWIENHMFFENKTVLEVIKNHPKMIKTLNEKLERIMNP